MLGVLISQTGTAGEPVLPAVFVVSTATTSVAILQRARMPASTERRITIDGAIGAVLLGSGSGDSSLRQATGVAADAGAAWPVAASRRTAG